MTLEFEREIRRPEPYYDEYEHRWIYPRAERPEPLTKAPLIGATITLARSSGDPLRFSDSHRRRPEMTVDPDTGRHSLTIEYSPLEAEALIGTPLADVGDLEEMQVAYAPLFTTLGLRFLRVTRVELLLNGQIAFESNEPSPSNAGGTKFALGPAIEDSSSIGATQ